MHTTAWPDAIEVGPGDQGFLSLAITNTSAVIDAYRVQVLGLDPDWVSVDPPQLSLFPGATENVSISVALPEDYPASQRTLALNVVSEDDPGNFALAHVALAVRPQTTTAVSLDPVMVTAGRKAVFGLVVTNSGNAAATATAFAEDPEALAEFTFEPRQVVVAPGREQVIRVTAQGGRSWFGQPRARTFDIGVDAERRVTTVGTFIQRPRIGRWLLSLLGLLTAAAVFAAVLSQTFNRVVEEARVNDELLDAALAAGEVGGAQVPSNPATVTGSLVLSSTGAGVAGAQAELYVDGTLDVPYKTAATDDTGSFTLGDLEDLTFKLRITGSGVNEIWYRFSPTAADASPIEVELGQITRLEPIEVGGVPVEVSGTVEVADPSGVTITLLAPGAIDPEVDPVVAEVEVAPDGSFTMPDVPSPGEYEMIIEQPGADTVVRNVVLQPGEALDDVQISLQPSTGLVRGSVSSRSGPLGGATITATDGSGSTETVSLTEDQIGTFALRNLAVPGQYTVTIAQDGYTSESRTVSLTDGQPLAQIDVTLLPALGSISGTALLEGAPGRGLTVQATGGPVNRTTSVVSQGPEAGAYSFAQLPAPGTYTLTFTGPDLIPQVRVVDLDPFSGNESRGDVNVSLSPEQTMVRGFVRDHANVLAPHATVTLTDGSDTFTVQSADEPVGGFEFSRVHPGTYTVSAFVGGTEPIVRLVEVPAGSPTITLDDLIMNQAATISGAVTGTTFDPTTQTAYVRLFDPALFPNGQPIATVPTDRTGNYQFTDFAAPGWFMVALYQTANSTAELDSESVYATPSNDAQVPRQLVVPAGTRIGP